ncbi:MAG TPA: ATP-binding protein [Stackebrandtia sp.]|jgi:two-component system OmpR family sensor kinase|uniref:sensor histidine kinase n=1 Tax=Stackebrandtia sp. TaxID=2023065 RepID=UPI002D28E2A9|nr:ATP-binding protein [Stackebrandtia sp.]HZE39559.1 ATP-binding protein [Stackebrandtia sp.]
MAIKTKLILATAILLSVATIVIGTVATGAVVKTMTNRIDRQVTQFMDDALGSLTEKPVETNAKTSLSSRDIAVLVIKDNGRVVQAEAAGFGDTKMPLPKVPRPLPKSDTPITLKSTSGHLEYRAVISDAKALDNVPGGGTKHLRLVAAAPLNEVADVRHSLIVTMAVTVALVLAVGVLAAWGITRRGMRPVTKMIDAAAAVADGDLERRLPARGERTEIGKLATALNIMVSKLVDAINQRDAQQNRLRTFVADASHELRTPLAAITGYAELYESGGVPSGPALDRAMARIRGESHRMAALVEDLLLLARLDQSSTPTRRPLDLRQLAFDAVDDARVADGAHPIDVNAEQPVPVSANEDHMRQVVVNLLTNARVHTAPDTNIAVTVTRHRNEAILTVADDGPGIPSAHRHRVFDRFYRADDSRSRDTGGTGLGLSIVKSIVESHEGRVELESQLGRGTCVRIVLPVTDAAV